MAHKVAQGRRGARQFRAAEVRTVTVVLPITMLSSVDKRVINGPLMALTGRWHLTKESAPWLAIPRFQQGISLPKFL